MVNVAFSDNSADGGGAIGNFDGSPSITNAVFVGNSATFDGGAISNKGFEVPARPTITNATFIGNTAGRQGGAIYNAGFENPASSRLRNAILWGNSAATGDEMYSFESKATPTLSHTIVEGGTGGVVDADGASTTYLDDSDAGASFANSTNLDADPQFVDAASPAGADRFTDSNLPYAADSVSYRLKQIDTNGSTSLTDPVTVARSGPEQVQLLGTAPNPARQRATARFAVPEDAEATGVTMRLYGVLGREVRTVRAEADPGWHEHTLDVSGLSSGVYVLRLRVGGQAKTRKLAVVR